MRYSRIAFVILAVSLLVGGIVIGSWAGGPKPVSAETPDPNDRVISVNGTGEVYAEPNICRLVVGVETQGKTAAEAQSLNTKATNAVIAKVLGLGIKEADVKTVSFNLYPVFDNGGRESAPQLNPIGYRASHRLQVTVRDLDKVAKVIDEAIAAGANTADEITYAVEETTELRNQALTKAVQQARSKGNAIAAAAGLKITEIKSISEGYVDFGSYRVPMAYDKAMAAGESMTVMPGEIVVRASVSMILRY